MRPTAEMQVTEITGKAARVTEINSKAAAKTEITAQRVLAEYVKIAFADTANYMTYWLALRRPFW